MKKYLFLTLIFSATIVGTTVAQNHGPAANSQQVAEPALTLQQQKVKTLPLMVEKTGLTEEQASKVIEILYEMRQGAAGLQDLSQAHRTAKLEQLKAVKDEKMSALLTADQIKAVKDFYKEFNKSGK